MYYALTLDSNGNGIGSHAYVEEPSSYPTNEIVCTEAQAQNPTVYQVVNGQIVESLSYAKTSQITLLQSALQKAEQSPIHITLSSGITTSFNMTSHDWTKIVGLYSKYVVKGDSLPTPYPLLDSRNVLQYITKIDIENLYNAGEAQTVNATTKFDTLVKSVQTATTVEAIKAIVW